MTDDPDHNRDPHPHELQRWERVIGYIGLSLVTLIIFYIIAMFLIWLTRKALL